MPDPFNGYRYLSHLRARWRLAAVVLVVAVGASLAISLLLPAKYTARVALIIEPPAGGDPRAATVVSPIYLESLRTYEHFASSDQLFAQAAEHFRLRERRSRSIEAVKRQVLRVSVPRTTKVLEIEATLTDPAQAHAVALYIAEETVKLSRETNRAGAEELVARAKEQVEAAAQRLEAAESAYLEAQRRGPSPEALKAEIEQINQVRAEVSRVAVSLELSVAELEAHESRLAEGGPGRSAELEGTRERLQNIKSRRDRLRQQMTEQEQRVSSLQKTLAVRAAEVATAAAELGATRVALAESEKRYREIETTVGFGGERLNLLDRGIVPERPSSPNVPLNLLVAAALGLMASLLYLTVEYSLRAQKAEAISDIPWISTRP